MKQLERFVILEGRFDWVWKVATPLIGAIHSLRPSGVDIDWIPEGVMALASGLQSY
jgi:hypothetical protein